MRVLIVGKGLIGNYLYNQIKGAELISSAEALSYIKYNNYDWVVNCTFDEEINNSKFKPNLSFDSKIIKNLKSTTCYLMLSSRKVYPKQYQWNAKEDQHIELNHIQNNYGKNKYLLENFSIDYLGSDRCLILRLPNIFGYNPSKSHTQTFFNEMYKNLKAKRTINFNFNKQTKRDFMYAKDLAFVIDTLIEKNITGIYNCGYGKPVTCLYLAEYLINKVGYGSIFDEAEYVDEFYLNTAKINKIFQFKNFIGIKKGINETLNRR